MANWNDIEVALNQGTIESLNKKTLQEFSAVEPKPSQNSAYHVRFEQAQNRIARALVRIETTERDKREEERHEKTLGLAQGANQTSTWALVIALLALIATVIQLVYR